MRKLDVVAAIDTAAEELTECDALPFLHALLRSARDEIVALRQKLGDAIDPQRDFRMAAAARRLIRAEALEEAARMVNEWAADGAEIVAAIRALKEQA